MREELELCPFCGKKAYLASLGSLGIYDDSWQVYCGDGCMVRTNYSTKENVIKTWNARPTPTPKKERSNMNANPPQGREDRG